MSFVALADCRADALFCSGRGPRDSRLSNWESLLTYNPSSHIALGDSITTQGDRVRRSRGRPVAVRNVHVDNRRSLCVRVIIAIITVTALAVEHAKEEKSKIEKHKGKKEKAMNDAMSMYEREAKRRRIVKMEENEKSTNSKAPPSAFSDARKRYVNSLHYHLYLRLKRMKIN